METFIQLIAIVIWPLTVITVLLLFRSELRGAAAKLTKIKFKDLTAEFGEQLLSVQKEAHNLVKESGNKIDLIKSGSLDEQLKRIAQISPQAAIMEAWREVEHALKILHENYYPEEKKNMPGQRNIRAMIVDGILPRSADLVYSKLRNLRTKAAHVPDFALETTQAETYIDTAHELLSTLNSKINSENKTVSEGQN